jgi:choline kinase
VRALILAAGRGNRLGGEAGDGPKCLVDVGGQSLLRRMLAALRAVGVRKGVMVIGHARAQMGGAVAGYPAGERPDLVFAVNKEYERGSILSLRTASTIFGEDDLLIMDADVLFPEELLRRLIESPHRNAFLLDPRSEAGGEEMMLVARGKRVVRIARRISPEPGDLVGEGVGFLKVCREDQAKLGAVLEDMVSEGQVDADYEQALDRFLAKAEVGFERVGDLPWTEVDFPEDLRRARDEVLPAIEALEG